VLFSFNKVSILVDNNRRIKKVPSDSIRRTMKIMHSLLKKMEGFKRMFKLIMSKLSNKTILIVPNEVRNSIISILISF
jgi:hypothetical protein